MSYITGTVVPGKARGRRLDRRAPRMPRALAGLGVLTLYDRSRGRERIDGLGCACGCSSNSRGPSGGAVTAPLPYAPGCSMPSGAPVFASGDGQPDFPIPYKADCSMPDDPAGYLVAGVANQQCELPSPERCFDAYGGQAFCGPSSRMDSYDDTGHALLPDEADSDQGCLTGMYARMTPLGLASLGYLGAGSASTQPVTVPAAPAAGDWWVNMTFSQAMNEWNRRNTMPVGWYPTNTLDIVRIQQFFGNQARTAAIAASQSWWIGKNYTDAVAEFKRRQNAGTVNVSDWARLQAYYNSGTIEQPTHAPIVPTPPAPRPVAATQPTTTPPAPVTSGGGAAPAGVTVPATTSAPAASLPFGLTPKTLLYIGGGLLAFSLLSGKR